MSTAVGYSYAVAAGGVVYAGVNSSSPALPAWLTAMTARTWAAIPSTVTLASLDITGNSTFMYPTSDWIGRGMASGAFAWTGYSWDEASKTWYAGMLGGHSDYGGNEPYKVSISASSTTWQRIRLPSGAKPGPNLVTKDGMEANGTMLYSDGRLRAHHSYHNHRYVPGIGLVICRATGAWFFPGGSDTRRAWTINTATGEATERANWIGVTGMGNGEGAFDHDQTRNCLWSMGSATSTLVQITNLAATTWTVAKRGLLDNWLKPSGAMRYIFGADRLALYPSFGGSGLAIINPATYAVAYPTLTGAFSAGFIAPDAAANQPGCGMEWCASLGCLLLWNNTSNTAQISTLTPSNQADLSQPWARGVLSVSGSNAVTPPVVLSDGIFGRFTYSPGLGVALLHSRPSQPIYAFKL